MACAIYVNDEEERTDTETYGKRIRYAVIEHRHFYTRRLED